MSRLARSASECSLCILVRPWATQAAPIQVVQAITSISDTACPAHSFTEYGRYVHAIGFESGIGATISSRLEERLIVGIPRAGKVRSVTGVRLVN